jgi:hypothetical protein
VYSKEYIESIVKFNEKADPPGNTPAKEDSKAVEVSIDRQIACFMRFYAKDFL